MVFYVYELRDPDTMLPFYVGKGSGDRMYRHENAVRNWATNRMADHNTYLYNKIKKILDGGKRVKHFKVFETNDENEAFEKEKELIKSYREAGFKLCNILDGGEGYSGGTHKLSEEAKQKIGNALRGKSKSIEHRKALSDAKYKNPIRAWKGKTFSAEHKRKLSEAAIARHKREKEALQNGKGSEADQCSRG